MKKIVHKTNLNFEKCYITYIIWLSGRQYKNICPSVTGTPCCVMPLHSRAFLSLRSKYSDMSSWNPSYICIKIFFDKCSCNVINERILTICLENYWITPETFILPSRNIYFSKDIVLFCNLSFHWPNKSDSINQSYIWSMHQYSLVHLSYCDFIFLASFRP